MEENVLIKSEQYNIKKVFIIIVVIGTIISALALLGMMGYTITEANGWYDYCYEKYLTHKGTGACGYGGPWGCIPCECIGEYPTKAGYIASEIAQNSGPYRLCLIPAVVFVLFGGLIYIWLRSYELIVTDRRVYGRVAFGKRVDLPVDSISSTSAIRLFKGVAVATSSGKISFLVIKNADEIYGVVNNLLVERQKEKAKETAPVVVTQSDEADQLKKYKDLLDSGVITQEEFDAKKKQLLGL